MGAYFATEGSRGMTTNHLTGSCLCGAVRIELSGKPHRVGLCHCLDCRKKTGAPFGAFAMYPRETLTVIGATRTHVRWSGAERHFCPDCGSSLYEIPKGSDEVEIFIGTIDETSRLIPTYELWTARREAWLPPFDLARHYTGDREGKGRAEP